MKNTILVCLTFIVSGCAFKPYQLPENAPLAQVRISAPEFSGMAAMTASIHKDGNCRLQHRIATISAIPVPNPDVTTTIPNDRNLKKNQYVDTYIEAGKEHKITFAGRIVNTACAINTLIRFEENKQYEVYYHWVGEQCVIELSQFIDGIREDANNLLINKEPVHCVN